MDENAEEFHQRALDNEDFESLHELVEYQALIPQIEVGIETEE